MEYSGDANLLERIKFSIEQKVHNTEVFTTLYYKMNAN